MNDKQLVAEYAASLIQDGMLVGLGTGSTANFFIEALARRRAEEGLRVTAAASSTISAIKARELGIPLLSMDQLTHLDIYVDGADEVTPDMTLLKGRGYDLVREKLMAKASQQFIVMIDESKLVGRIGEKFPIPVEVMPFAWQLVKKSLEAAGASGGLRQTASKDGLSVTSHGSLVLDITFDQALSGEEVNTLLNATPGVVEHGIFRGLASKILLAKNGSVEVRQ